MRVSATCERPVRVCGYGGYVRVSGSSDRPDRVTPILPRWHRSATHLGSRKDRRQLTLLLAFAEKWPRRRFAVEGANGLGRLLAQQLVEAGEAVIDVPPTLSARVRLLSPAARHA